MSLTPILPRPAPWPVAALLLGALLLAWRPASWLFGTWSDPSYASDGALAALAVAGLLLWSLSSPRRAPVESRPVALCLIATSLVRLVSELLGVNVLGATMLAIDVGIVAVWLGTAHRERAVSPFWLSVLFLFALPLERILQRTGGYLLQQVSAAGACGLLELGPDPVLCEGLRIVLNGREALVDLPCSGARGLLALLMLFATSAALARPRLGWMLFGLGATIAAALIANMFRIAALALGLAYRETVGVDVMAAPWHEAIGLVALGLAALPVLLWARGVPSPVHKAVPAPKPLRPVGAVEAAAFLVIAVLVVTAVPTRPLDVAAQTPPVTLPATLIGSVAVPEPLTEKEAAYFTRYGGAAARARYGANVLMVVRTTAPLRHLHAPDECLRGAGFAVRHVGVSYGSFPTAIYRATDPDGTAWRVSVSFTSDRGERASSVSEATWRWLRDPGAVWTMTQRITPWSQPDPRFEAAALRALDLPFTESAPTAKAAPAASFSPSQGG